MTEALPYPGVAFDDLTEAQQQERQVFFRRAHERLGRDKSRDKSRDKPGHGGTARDNRPERKLEARPNRGKSNGKSPETPAKSAKPAKPSDWTLAAQTDKSGNPIPNLYNAVLWLANDPAFAPLQFDEMHRAPRYLGRVLDEPTAMGLHHALQANGLRRVTYDVTLEACRIVATRQPIHPLRDWLSGLVWDGTLRLGNWTHVYLGTPDDPYHDAIGAWFLTAMVARVMQPGCQADYMIVLEGPQGELKSQVCRCLGGAYFSDALPAIGDDPVRTSSHLRGKWLIEIAELHAFSKADAALLKSFISRQDEHFTPKFGRLEVHEPRQCCFIGTTNEDTYVKDDTGGRRFWPVKCGAIDLDALKRDRDQLFAEGVEAYRNDAHWWPDRNFERQHIEPEQSSRLIVDPWDEPIAVWLVGKSLTTLSEVARDCLGIPLERDDMLKSKRIAAALRRAGWERKRSTGGTHVWLRKPQASVGE